MSARERTGSGAKKRASQAPNDDTSPLHRLQARGEQLLGSLAELRKTILPEGEQSIDTVLGQFEKVRDTVSRRAQETGRDIEARAEQALGELEHEVVRRLGPVFTRANVLSRADVAPLESRIAHLEGRLGTVLDDRATLTSRVLELERNLDEARAIASEREREATMALSTGDGLLQAITDVREHLDSLSRDQMSRNLESGKQEDRLGRLETRLGELVNTQTTSLTELERKLNDATTHEREAGVAVSTDAGLQLAIADLREHLDSLSRDQVSRNLESGKFEDRLMRIEIRLGELLKEQSARSTEKETLQARLTQVDETLAVYGTRLGDLHKVQTADTDENGMQARLAEVTTSLNTHEAQLRNVEQEHRARASEKEAIHASLARVNETLEESARTLGNAATEATAAIAATRELNTHIETLREERTTDRGEFFQLAQRLGDIERTLRQCDLRLGDLTERHTAGREELASLAARISQLELAAARPSSATNLRGQPEGH